jgi:hypothetical protein
LGRVRDATKDKMIEILKAIEVWAINKGFSLSIDKELMDLIK